MRAKQAAFFLRTFIMIYGLGVAAACLIAVAAVFVHHVATGQTEYAVPVQILAEGRAEALLIVLGVLSFGFAMGAFLEDARRERLAWERFRGLK